MEKVTTWDAEVTSTLAGLMLRLTSVGGVVSL
jgi:hypothetical protein